jgi:hypothetical protein
VLQSFAELADKEPSVLSTSLDRLRALKQFLSAVEAKIGYLPWHFKEVAQFMLTQDIGSDSSDAELTKEEYEAIGAIG